MASQWAQGNQNVQIHDVGPGSNIRISFDDHRREVPLQPAVVSVAAHVRSPGRLLRARAGVVPYVERGGVLGSLVSWSQEERPFGGYLIGGRGGTGKTRLAVELCKRAEEAGWLCGMLAPQADSAALEALAEAPTPRLVVVDYAENRAEQVEVALPALVAHASEQYPVRVLLLVRAAPRRSNDWSEALRSRGDLMDATLDLVDQLVLQDTPFSASDRARLFDEAAKAFAARAEITERPSSAPPPLASPAFANPLLVVTAAYLSVHSAAEVPTTRTELLDELVDHEDRYWASSATTLETDRPLRERVVALATLAGADDEREAVDLLRLLPDLSDASAERRGRLARWVHDLYPGTARWWNPLEPDLVGEHLIAGCFTDSPDVLAGVLDRLKPQSAVQPLDTYARAAADHPQLAAVLASVMGSCLAPLCAAATEQAATEIDLGLMLGGTTLAAALNRAVTAIVPKPSNLIAALNALPSREDLILGPLALTLTAQVVEVFRQLAAGDPAAYAPDLAKSLNNLSIRLAEAGRRDEGLTAIQDAVDISRQLVVDDPAAYGPYLAGSLNNLSLRLAEAGRRDEGLTAVQDAVDIYRQLAVDDPVAYEPDLAGSLNNLSSRLAETGRRDEGLTAVQDAVDIYRQLAAVNPAPYESALAMSLNNLSNRLAEAGRAEEALIAIQDAVDIRRSQAAANPAAYGPYLAGSLNNLSIRLAEAGRWEEALTAIQDTVDIYHQLAAANPSAYEPNLAMFLNNLSNRLAEAGRAEEALIAIQDAVGIRRSLAAANPAAYEPDLAGSLNNLSNRLTEAGHREEGLTAIQEAVDIYRRLAAASPAAHTSDLAMSLNTLFINLTESGRLYEAEAIRQELLRLDGQAPE